MLEPVTAAQVLQATRDWLLEAVIGLNLCPFARRELETGRLHVEICEHTDTVALMQAFASELARLEEDSAVETTLLVFSNAVQDFGDYLDLLDLAQDFLASLSLEGVYQLASFHPQYCFADSEETDAANFTNRSPWPVIHLLRERSVEAAVKAHGHTEDIPLRNIRVAREKGMAWWQARLADWQAGRGPEGRSDKAEGQ